MNLEILLGVLHFYLEVLEPKEPITQIKLKKSTDSAEVEEKKGPETFYPNVLKIEFISPGLKGP